MSFIGSQAFLVALAFWVKRETESATLMGLLLVAYTLPTIVFGPLGGSLADRHSRKTILIVTDFLSGVVVLGVTVLLWKVGLSTWWSIYVLYAAAAVLGLLNALFRPTLTAAIPDLVPHDQLRKANAFERGTVQASILVGQGLGGILFQVLGAPILSLINAISFIFCAISVFFVDIPQRKDGNHSLADTTKSFWKDTKTIFAYVWNNKGLRTIFMITALVQFFGAPFVTLLPFFVENTLGGNAVWYGYILAMFGVGSLVGFALTALTKFGAMLRAWLLLVALIVVAFVLSIIGFAPGLHWLLYAAGIVGAAVGVLMVYANTMVQSVVPHHLRGRAFGLLGTITSGLTPIAIGLGGVATDLLDQRVPLVYFACGICLLVVSAFVVSNVSFLRFLVNIPEKAKA